MVSYEVVVWISDPETSWCLISVEPTPRPLGLHDQVLFNDIVSLDSVFNEDVMALNIVYKVLLHPQIAGSMERQGSVETLMNSVTNDVGVVHVSNHVEMDGVSPKLKTLSDVEELDIGNPRGKRVISY